MNAAKHTPGPWSGGKDIPVRAFDTEALGFSIIYINTGSSARKEVSMANARLIGAAPDMLNTLVQLEAKALLGASACDSQGPAEGFRVLAEFARAAIAKAQQGGSK